MGALQHFLGIKKSRYQEMTDKLAALDQVQAVIEFSMDGNIVHANQTFLSVMGYSLEEVVGQHHSIFISPEEKKTLSYREFWAALNRGENRVAEFKRIGKNGKEVWINASYNPLFDSFGKPYKVVKFATDITRQKNEAELHRNNSDLASALKVCQANVMLADQDMKITYLNDNVCDMLRNREKVLQAILPNFSVDKLVGMCVDSFHKNPSHQRGILNNLTDSYETDLSIAGLTFGLIASPWFDTNGQRIGTVVEWEDKTERIAKENDEAAKAARNSRIKQALDVCDTSVMLADDDQNIIYMNQAVEKMLRHREVELRQALPNFNVSQLLGANIDAFHKDPSYQRGLLKDLRNTHTAELTISSFTFGLIATPLYDQDDHRLGTVVEWEDKTDRIAKEEEEKSVADENARLRLALDKVTANVMIADPDANILYTNESLHAMFKKAEPDIRRELSHFNANDVIGKNMDIFHKDRSHQRHIIENLKTTHKGRAEISGRTFSVIATPIVVGGERLGTVIEWDDRTAEVSIEKDIAAMVDSASKGDFSEQLTLDGKGGFFETLSRGLNDVVSTMEVSMNDIIRMLGAMARGDLSERITRDYYGSFGQLKNDANTTANKLTEIIGRIRASSRLITSAASELAQGNADLSQRTEEQASSLEETASSMEEMTSTVRQSAENAMKANSLAHDAQQKAQSGGEVVKNAVQAMEEINSSSKKISDIISVIDEIAFQTNLLALNAAVEAARAGEQGRGFAVVAGEVRNLAQRSAGAAKEIKELIRDSVGKVQDGQKLVNASGETLADIVGAVESVCLMMQEISDAAQEQTSGIEQVNTAVSQMDEMTQQNAALVEQATAAGQSMSEQASALDDMVQFFTVSEGAATETIVSTVATSPKVAAVSATPMVGGASAFYSPGSSQDDDEWEDF